MSEPVATSELDTCIAGGIQHELTMFLKRLASQDLGEEVRRVRLALDVTDGDAARTSELAHLEKLTVDVA